MNDLEPCPFCGNEDIKTEEIDLLVEELDCFDGRMHAICFSCGASAPIEKWNTRQQKQI